MLYPIEIKKKDMPSINDASAFDVLDKDIEKKRGLGVILSSNKNKIYLRDNLVCLPLEYIWYVSNNPKDMFPRSFHVETVISLQLKIVKK